MKVIFAIFDDVGEKNRSLEPPVFKGTINQGSLLLRDKKDVEGGERGGMYEPGPSYKKV